MIFGFMIGVLVGIAMHVHKMRHLSIALSALEKIEDPRKIGHSEPDEYTQKGCLMNIAHVALEKIRGTYGE